MSAWFSPRRLQGYAASVQRTWLPSLFVSTVLAGAALAGCVVEPGPDCCANEFDCAAGGRCFEGQCALACRDDADCAEGEACVLPAGVCALELRRAEDSSCAWEEDTGDRR